MATIKRHAVESSHIASIGYDPDTETLEIEFHKGGTYQYSNFPENLWVEFENSESKGKYFHRNIRKGGYDYAKL